VTVGVSTFAGGARVYSDRSIRKQDTFYMRMIKRVHLTSGGKVFMVQTDIPVSDVGYSYSRDESVTGVKHPYRESSAQ
jgi:hypothetical protein